MGSAFKPGTTDLSRHATERLSAITNVLAKQAVECGSRGYLFLRDGDSGEISLSFAELHVQATVIASKLRQIGARGDRILLLFPPGLQFISAFLGCVYGDRVAVPAYPPRKSRGLVRLSAIAEDCKPSAVLTTRGLLENVREWAYRASPDRELSTFAIDEIDCANNLAGFHATEPDPDSVAFLQYTSGSTAAPKGVMVTHRALMANEEIIRQAFRQSETSVVVSWLPMYHDMGLIGGILQPLYVGATCVLMSPMAFLDRPRRWLEAIDRYRGTTSGGPNFAYELCVRRIPPAERSGLDLSSWTVAFNGSEPVRAETIERFANAFAQCGFRKSALYPCYGLAEATLFVTGGVPEAGAHFKNVNARELTLGRIARDDSADAKALVACGRIGPDHALMIVNPETREECGRHEVGEIWTAGPSVGAGYWNRGEETEQVFHARLASEERSAPWLRTGDLGFFDGDELFVTGRLKDLIIARGRNLYPQDLEYVTERAHASLKPGSGAAFSITVEGDENVVIVQEVERRPADFDADTVAQQIRSTIAEEHEIRVHEIVFVRVGTVPKTSSGKVQRYACKKQYLAGELDVVARFGEQQTAARETNEAIEQRIEQGRTGTLADILCEQAARVLRVAPNRIDCHQPLVRLGLDSLAAMEFKSAVEDLLPVVIPIKDLLEGVSIADLAHRFASAEVNGHIVSPKPLVQSTETIFPLSFGQRGLWFSQRLAGAHSPYHINFAAQLDGALDVGALERCFHQLAERHAALRTTFFQNEQGEPRQKVHDFLAPEFSVRKLATTSELHVAQMLSEEAWRPFDLNNGPLLRISVFENCGQAGTTAIVFSVHHLVADFATLALLFEELSQLYTSETLQVPVTLSPIGLSYAEHVALEASILDSAEGELLWSYWREALKPTWVPTELPADRPRPAVQSYRGASRSLILSEELTRDIRGLAHGNHASYFTVLLTALDVLLHRHTSQRDIVVGCPAAGRRWSGYENTAGYFVNPLPIRVQVVGGLSFRELVQEVRLKTVGALEHQHYPFALLAERLHPKRDPSRTPLFQIMFAFQQSRRRGQECLPSFALGETGATVSLGPLMLTSIGLSERHVPFDLSWIVADEDKTFQVSAQYNCDLFDLETVERLLAQFEQLLQTAARNPEQRVQSLSVLTEQERRNLLFDWNRVEPVGDGGILLHHLFETQAELTPDARAITDEQTTLSYAELESRANRLSGYLRTLGVGPETITGICLERGIDLAVAMLAVLKTGGAYLPLDPSHPVERLKLILDDAHADVVLRKPNLPADLAASGSLFLDIDSIRSEVDKQADIRSSAPALPDSAAYLLYTSGSTGKPKGVLVPHRAVVNFIRSMAEKPGLRSDDVLLSVTTPSFDIFGLELYLPLTVGAQVLLPDRQTTGDGARLLAMLKTHRVTTMQATPATWRLLLAAKWEGEPRLKVLCGGEALPWDLAKELQARASSVWNLYGPTETTIWSGLHDLSGSCPETVCVPIGRPIADTQFYCVDAHGDLTPTGTPGELLIGGAGLANGYWKRPSLTAERFVPDPFSDRAGARIYRTGDLA